MRAFRAVFRSAFRSTLSSLILFAGLSIASTAAHAAVRVVVAVGPYGYPVYAQDYAPPCPGPGYNWTPAYYSYGQYYPGRWVAAREWREHEYREHEWREHRDGDRDRYQQRDREDRHYQDWDDHR
jgi:hypothetical protein